jgi:cAMP-dependent protein kinase regulator
LVVPSYALGRRTSVSAESLVPTAQGGRTNGAPGESDATAVLREPKTESQLARIKQSIAPNFLFRNLDEEQERDVLAAMKEVSVKKGQVIIEQGAAGDYFYVVDSGSFDIFVNKPGEHVGDDASELENKWGKKVGTCKSGMSFGELALMYK